MKNITLWTIQPLDWYENFIEHGVICTDTAKIDEDFFFDYPYQWLVKQMLNKIGKPCLTPNQTSYSKSSLLPIWAWYQYEGINKKRPDLRYSGHLEKGTLGVRVEFTKPQDSIVLSDFDLWHAVLNNWYIADSEDDDKRFDDFLAEKGVNYHYDFSTNPIDVQKAIELSWLKVFDLKFDSTYSSLPIDKKSIQATFWSLSTEDVVSIDKFIAK